MSTIKIMITTNRNITTAKRIIVTAEKNIATAKRNITTTKRIIATAIRNLITTLKLKFCGGKEVQPPTAVCKNCGFGLDFTYCFVLLCSVIY